MRQICCPGILFSTNRTRNFLYVSSLIVSGAIVIFTAHKQSLWRLCFTGVCLSTGEGVCPIAYWDTHPPGPEADTPWARPPPRTRGRHPRARHPPGRTPPCAVHAGIRSTSGRYASHWTAFLFQKASNYCTYCTGISDSFHNIWRFWHSLRYMR